MNARDAIEILRAGYLFDGVEVDGMLRLVPRSGSSLREIPYTELVIEEGDNQAVIESTLNEEYELPSRLTITCPAAEVPHEPASASSPMLSRGSKQTETRDLTGLFLTQARRTRTAEIAHRDLWIGRKRRKWAVGPQHADLVQNDVVTLELTNGDTVVVRIMSRTDNGLRIAFESRDFDSVIDAPTSVGSTIVSGATQLVNAKGASRVLVLDIPPLRIGDDGFFGHVAVAQYGPDQGVATVYESRDQVAFDPILVMDTSATMGTALTVLADWTGGNVVDHVSTVRVRLMNGELESCTYAELFEGVNRALIGDEIVFFQTATQVGTTNDWDLSVFLRARRGTIEGTATHAVGDRFVMLDFDALELTPFTIDDIGDTFYHRALTHGGMQALDVAEESQLTYAANSRLPLPPANVIGVWLANGDVMIRWAARRARLDWIMRSGTEVPLDEDTEEYEVDVLDDAGAVVRTFTGIDDDKEQLYTAAQQATDHTTARLFYTVMVYQVSALVGRGRPAAVEINRFLGYYADNYDSGALADRFVNVTAPVFGFSLFSGRLYAATALNSNCTGYFTRIAAARNFRATFTAEASSFNELFFCFRSLFTDDYRRSAYFVRMSGSGLIHIIKGSNSGVSTTTTTLATVSSTFPAGDPVAIEVQCVDSGADVTIRVYQDGVLVVNATDTSSPYQQSGQFLLGALSTSISGTFAAAIDDLVIHY